MWIKPRNVGSTHALCLAKHINARSLVQRCRDRVRPTPPGVATGDDPAGIRSTAPSASLLNASNCDELAAAIDPLCAFAVGGSGESGERWTAGLDRSLKDEGSFTLSMWVRRVPATALDRSGRFR
eukprot:3727930-Rhodomonas_salina.1